MNSGTRSFVARKIKYLEFISGNKVALFSRLINSYIVLVRVGISHLVQCGNSDLLPHSQFAAPVDTNYPRGRTGADIKIPEFLSSSMKFFIFSSGFLLWRIFFTNYGGLTKITDKSFISIIFGCPYCYLVSCLNAN